MWQKKHASLWLNWVLEMFHSFDDDDNHQLTPPDRSKIWTINWKCDKFTTHKTSWLSPIFFSPKNQRKVTFVELKWLLNCNMFATMLAGNCIFSIQLKYLFSFNFAPFKILSIFFLFAVIIVCYTSSNRWLWHITYLFVNL